MKNYLFAARMSWEAFWKPCAKDMNKISAHCLKENIPCTTPFNGIVKMDVIVICSGRGAVFVRYKLDAKTGLFICVAEPVLKAAAV